MSDISEECRKYLRELDHRLQSISWAADHESPSSLALETAILQVRRVTEAAHGLDEDCRKILRDIDPRLDDIDYAIRVSQGYDVIHQRVEAARAAIPPEALLGGIGTSSSA